MRLARLLVAALAVLAPAAVVAAPAAVVAAPAAVEASAPAAVKLHLGPRARRHIVGSHFPGGRWTAHKSLFNKGEDLEALIALAASAPPKRQRNGRDKRVADAGRPIGINDRNGKPVTTIVVISDPDGEVVTAYPGR